MKSRVQKPEQVQDESLYQPPKEVQPEHHEFLRSIGNKLQELRNNKKLSSSGLAKQLGISRNAYSQMEKGKTYFYLLNLLKVLDFHNKSATEFFKEL